MKCKEARSLLSPYLDNAVSSARLREVARHLQSCGSCDAEFAVLKQTQWLVASVGRKQAPADLALKLRVAISQEAAARSNRSLQGLSVRLENAFQTFMVPAMAGMVTAMIIFGLLIGMFALPSQLQARSNDVPTMLYTPPELASSPMGYALGTMNTDSLVVEAYVDANGRVQDYRILSAPNDTQSLLPELKNTLIFTVFRPATSFGRPTSGRAVLSFSKINVKG